MGIFGESARERALAQEVRSLQDELSAMETQHRTDLQGKDGRITGLEQTLQATNQEKDRALETLAVHEDVLTGNRATIDWQRAEMERWKSAAGPFGRWVLQFLREAEQSDEVKIDAESEARTIASTRIRDTVKAYIINELLEDKEREVRRELGSDGIKKLRDDIDAVFQGDGTYKNLAEQVADKVYDEQAEEIKKKKKEEILAQLLNDESISKRSNHIIDTMQKDGTYDKMYADAVEELQSEFETEALERAKEEIEASLEDNRPKIEEEVKKSYDFVKKLASMDTEATKRWNKLTTEKVLQQFPDHELNLLHTEKLLSIKRTKERKELREALIKEFEKVGMLDADIPEGMSLEVYFGDVDNENETADIKAIVKMLSLGDGQFLVHSAESTGQTGASIKEGSILVHSAESTGQTGASIKEGSIVKIGQLILSGPHQTTLPKIIRLSKLYYELTTITNSTNYMCIFDVVTIKIDGEIASWDNDNYFDVTLPDGTTIEL